MRAAFFVGFGGVTFPRRAFTDNSDVIILCPGLGGAFSRELCTDNSYILEAGSTLGSSSHLGVEFTFRYLGSSLRVGYTLGSYARLRVESPFDIWDPV